MGSKTIRRPRINSAQAKSLFKTGKTKGSITLVAEKLGASYAGVRNNLIRQRIIRP
ncbi:Uncharacterised protein [uncultured archaeon]|nr:Uncharacterised protein [uncultured archaeon]